MKADLLRRPFSPDQVKQRQGQGGKVLSYVETHAVISRLNDGLDAWSFEIMRHEILDDEVVVVGKLTADGIIKMSFGGSAITRDRDGRCVSIADDLKSAGSDALKKAASLLGVGLELYSGAATAERQRRTDRQDAVQEQRGPAAALGPADRLTGRQFSAVQSVARRKNLSRDRLSDMLRDRFNKSDLNALTRREASSILSELTEANGAAH
jgi:hypothetical protein